MSTADLHGAVAKDIPFSPATSPGQPVPGLNVIPGAKLLNMGAIGTGKTHVLRTLLNTGLKVFGTFTEPNALIVMGDVLDQIHYNLAFPVADGWANLIMQAKKLNTMDLSAMSKGTGNRINYQSFMKILENCNNFKDQRGESFGDIGSWGTDRVYFIDSLSGINKMIRQLIVGDRVTMTLPEYGAAQQATMSFLDKILLDSRCHFILNCHMELNKDEILGGVKRMPMAIGNKLAPILPTNFNDCIMSYTEGDQFFWKTTAGDADLKTNNMERSQKIPQDYRIWIEGWKRKGGVIAS